jgi:hypothetical protein
MDVDEEVPPPPPPPPRVAAGEADDDAVGGEVGGGQKGEGKEEDIEGLEAAGVGEEAGEEEGALHGLVLQVTKIASADAAVKVYTYSYIYIYIYTFTYMDVRTCVDVFMDTYHAHTHTHTHTNTYTNMYINTHTNTHAQVQVVVAGRVLEGALFQEFKSGDEGANVAWQWLNSGTFRLFFGGGVVFGLFSSVFC